MNILSEDWKELIVRFIEGEEPKIKKPVGNHVHSSEWRKHIYREVDGLGLVHAVPLVKAGGSLVLRIEMRWFRGSPVNQDNPYVIVENNPDGSFTVKPWDESKYGAPQVKG